MAALYALFVSRKGNCKKSSRFILGDMKKERKESGVAYDPESDVLAWEISDKPIAYAKEIGTVIVHFTNGHAPALIEVLEASRLVPNPEKLLKENVFPFPRIDPAA